MRDVYIFYTTGDEPDVVSVDKNEVLTTLFCDALMDKGIQPWEVDKVRCASTTLVNEIHRYLIDKYGLD